MTMISVVIPVFRSARILPDLYERLATTLDEITPDWEVILVDDASGDGTFDVAASLHEKDARVKAVHFARNMGQHHATLCGLQRARGEYVITMDDDLQNPPEEIPRFIATIDDGFDLVIGRISASKQHSASRNFASRTVQTLVGRILGKPRDLELSSYRGMSRRVATEIAAFTGAHVYMPALMLRSAPDERMRNIDVEHHTRPDGRSGYTLRKLVQLVSYLLINHSYAPLRFVTAWGFILSLASFGYAVFVGLSAVIYGSAVAGFPTLALLISFLSGNILLCIGILGEYIGRLVEENNRATQFPVFEERD